METHHPLQKTDEIVEFKSYYVVWKQNISQTRRAHKKKFKSYYVVWKLDEIGKENPQLKCLNRTMQYGNEF